MSYRTLLLIVLCLPGCASVVRSNGTQLALRPGTTVLLPHYDNATVNENAGRALTELTATELMKRNLAVHQIETRENIFEQSSAISDLAVYRDLAKKRGDSYIVFGTVHEYDFKTDLDGSPAIGITLKLIDPLTGTIVRQGSSSQVGHFSSSLTSTAQRAVDKLLDRMLHPN